MNEPGRYTSETNAKLWGARADDWADIQEGQTRAVYSAVFDRVGLRPGQRYLDAGCGAGMAAQMAAAMGARVAGLDAAPALIEIARRRTPSGDFRIGELEALPFDDGTFDVVTGFNSFQFAARPVAALESARRVTRPGGFVVIVTWGTPEGMPAAQLVGALKPLLPAPPPGAPGPFALSEENALRGLATASGLTPLEVMDVSTAFAYPDLATAVRGLNSSGVAMRAIELVGEAAVSAAHEAVLKRFEAADGALRIPATFRCLLARP